MNRIALSAALAAACLAGCSKAPQEPAKPAAVAGKAHAGGLWETRIFIGGEQMPDVTRACVKGGLFDPLSRFAKESGCASVARSETPSGYTFTTSCIQDGVTSRTTGSAEVKSDTIVINTRSSVEDAPQVMEMRLESRRIGPCPAGMAVEAD